MHAWLHEILYVSCPTAIVIDTIYGHIGFLAYAREKFLCILNCSVAMV